MGAVVESWLKFFYTVYYEDYCNAPITRTNKNGNSVQIEPEKTSFEKLKQFSNDKLWKDSFSDEYKWMESVQQKRNAIHSFRYREIGTQQEFLDDIDHLYAFVENVTFHFPPLEDYVETYPASYVMNAYFD